MELLVLLLSVVNLLLAAAVILGGRYVFRRLDQLEEHIHQTELRAMEQDPARTEPDKGSMGSTAWNE
ncbi:MAG: hypothetical protein COV99_04245 [Bacteroidetes bacterium CG12_big_fil_rev_8_21_14_0_65_60_17]|nr:MAG: hypothetical protein COV99_04245 [Bacteroidetes bacterium CG12_big_fil_rev_8_21_14_0_65_60_17]